MLTTTQPLIIIVLYMIKLTCCSGPDFSDIRFLGNKGYRIPSQAIYKKVYGGNGKRYGVHFPGRSWKLHMYAPFGSRSGVAPVM